MEIFSLSVSAVPPVPVPLWFGFAGAKPGRFAATHCYTMALFGCCSLERIS